MILSTYQPYFAPFPGFFSKAACSDTFVLMDSVQFPLGATWLTRNRFKNDQGVLLLTIPVWKKGLGLQQINHVRICYEKSWPEKYLAGLNAAYANAPFFKEHRRLLQELFSNKYDRLIDLNLKIIRYLMDYLMIPAKLILLSELDIDAKEPGLTLEICKKLKASHFLAQKSAKKYLDKELFKRSGINLEYSNYRAPVYPQLWGPNILNLSVFDLIFNCGPRTREIITDLQTSPK